MSTAANAVLTILPSPFTIFSEEHQRFASRHGDLAILMSKAVIDGHCYMTPELVGGNKFRFRLETRAIVFRHSDNGNLHSRFGNESASDTVFELIPRADGTFFIKADNGLYVSVYDSSGLHLRAAKREADIHCVFLLRDPSDARSIDDIKKSYAKYADEASVTFAPLEI
ncbi:hypothetical protein DFQ27_003265 [Actinomortierella ambigua]|uniref:Uncharacterized protein n=1 Tax=Actinomortierella ambigua TaxID=1343610 RepID=A0A9P6U648_9FUNG|nr:hypothetical protein DFQ27_003265 [Actinomortierella ambigua]